MNSVYIRTGGNKSLTTSMRDEVEADNMHSETENSKSLHPHGISFHYQLKIPSQVEVIC